MMCVMYFFLCCLCVYVAAAMIKFILMPSSNNRALSPHNACSLFHPFTVFVIVVVATSVHDRANTTLYSGIFSSCYGHNHMFSCLLIQSMGWGSIWLGFCTMARKQTVLDGAS